MDWRSNSVGASRHVANHCVFTIIALAAISASHVMLREANAQSIVYFYDDLGRLKRVIDQNGDVATYNYDAVGNILSIERGPGSCPVGPPSVGAVTSRTCFAGAGCQVSIDGQSLLGAGIRSDDPRIAVTDCRTDCQRITCVVTATPDTPSGPVDVAITTPLGAATAAVEIFPPPRLGGANEAGLWQFAANAGETITLAMTRIPNQPDGSSTLDPALEIYDSRGFLLAADDDGGTNQPLGPGRNAVVRDRVLPATDTYRVVARGSGGTAGPYVLEMTPPTISLVPLDVGSTTPEGRLVVFSGEIPSAGALASHSFAANRSERATIDVLRVANAVGGRSTLDPAVELRDSRGFSLASDSDGGTNVPEGPGRNAKIPNFLLPATDTYRVVVSGEGGSVGPYQVRITLTPQN